MLVKHLIRELQKCPPDAPVSTEGCDCYGESYAVKVESDGVSIIRNPLPSFDTAYREYDNTQDTPEPLLVEDHKL